MPTPKEIAPETQALFQCLNDALPQTQCTRCGYPDCASYALAMALGQAPINQCPPGGEEGIQDITPLIKDPLHYYWFVLALLGAITWFLAWMARSRWGLILRAIRGDEATCLAAGLPITTYKIASLIISAAFAGLGGALYAHYQLQVSPQLFAVVTSITIITMVYVGGMGTIFGPVGGALLLTLMTEGLRNFGEWRLMVYSLLLIFILFFLPNGIVAPTWNKIRNLFSQERP